MIIPIVNFVLFQAGWFACVLGAAWGTYWLGPVSAIGVVGVYLVLTDDRKRSATNVVLAAALGPALDAVLAHTGTLTYPGGLLAGLWPPLWIIALWAMFGSTFDSGLVWMYRRPLVAALFAAVFAPLSYRAGHFLGAVETAPDPLRWILPVAVLWGVGLPGLLWLSNKFNPPAPMND
jgi:hypothetical protein